MALSQSHTLSTLCSRECLAGDLVPDTYVLRIFTCFFALSGVACLGIAIGVIGNNVMEAQEAAVKQTKTLAQNRVFGLFQKINDGNNQEESRTPEGDPSRDDDGADSSSSSSNSSNSKMNPVWQLLLHFSFVLFILVIFAFAEANDPGIDVTWNIFDALYFAIITATTVGYGMYTMRQKQIISTPSETLTLMLPLLFRVVIAQVILRHRRSGGVSWPLCLSLFASGPWEISLVPWPPSLWKVDGHPFTNTWMRRN